MKKKLNKIAKDTNNFLKKYLKSQKKNRLNNSNEIWIVAWRKKN